MSQGPVSADLPREFCESETPFAEQLAALGVAYGPGWPDRFGQVLREHASEASGPATSTLSLFSGGGGLDLGFHDWNFSIEEAVELEQKYVRTLETNAHEGGPLDGTNIVCEDIREYTPPRGLKPEFIIGGPPCQTFSAAGRRASGVTGTDDPRGELFWEYVRLLEELQPAGFVFENVYGILGAQGGEPWQQICDAFVGAGYSLSFRILDAADYGVPQHRERLFIVGLREGEFRFPEPTHGPDSSMGQPYFSAGEAVALLDPEIDSGGIGGRFGDLLEDIPPGLNYSFYTEKLGHPRPVFAWRSKFSDYLYKADPTSPIRTLKAKGGQYTGPFHWDSRVFTLPELKRLQTFPDTYSVLGGRGVGIEQLGNSVPPQLARILALAIGDQVFGHTPPISLRYMEPGRELGFRKRKRALTELYKQKALEAHSAGVDGPLPPKRRSKKNETVRYLDSDFGWGEATKPASTEFRCEIEVSQPNWKLAASSPEKLGDEPVITIEVSPVGESWVIPAEKVLLTTPDLTGTAFTALWKLFGEVMSEETGMSDLVQLAGYYQYPTAVRCQMKIAHGPDTDKRWARVREVVNGTSVASTMPLSQFSAAWDVGGEEEAREALDFLRALGYEVRSHRTNSQIEKGSFLIPYRFPTLTPQSVQLRKTL